MGGPAGAEGKCQAAGNSGFHGGMTPLSLDACIQGTGTADMGLVGKCPSAFSPTQSLGSKGYGAWKAGGSRGRNTKQLLLEERGKVTTSRTPACGAKFVFIPTV